MFDDTAKRLSKQIFEKTIPKEKIPEDQSIEYYRRLQIINYMADEQSRSWNLYCKARYFYKEKKMYSESIDYLWTAFSEYRCFDEHKVKEYFSLLADIIFD